MPLLLMAGTINEGYFLINENNNVTHHDIRQMVSIPAENMEIFFYDETLFEFGDDWLNSGFKSGKMYLSGKSSLQNYDYYMGVIDKNKLVVKNDKRIKVIKLFQEKSNNFIESFNIIVPSHPVSEELILVNDGNMIIYSSGDLVMLVSLERYGIIKYTKIDWSSIGVYNNIAQARAQNKSTTARSRVYKDQDSHQYTPHNETLLDVKPIKISIASMDNALFMAAIIKNMDNWFLSILSLDGSFQTDNIHWAKNIKLNTDEDIFTEKHAQQAPEIALSTDKFYIIYGLLIIIVDQKNGDIIFYHFFDPQELYLQGLVVNKDGHVYTQGTRHIYGVSSDMKLVRQKYVSCKKELEYIDHSVTPAEGMIINSKNQLIIVYISETSICIDHTLQYSDLEDYMPNLLVMVLAISENGSMQLPEGVNIDCHTLLYSLDKRLASIPGKFMTTWKIGLLTLFDNGKLTIPLGVFNRKSCDYSAPIFSALIMQEVYQANATIDKCAPWAKKFKDNENTCYLSARTHPICKENASNSFSYS